MSCLAEMGMKKSFLTLEPDHYVENGLFQPVSLKAWLLSMVFIACVLAGYSIIVTFLLLGL